MYRFSSSQTAQPNFSFIVEINLNGSVIFQSRIFPENGIYAHYDASDIVKYRIPKPTLSTVLAQDNGTMQNVSLTVTENYGTPPVDVGTATSTVTRTWKAGLSDEDFLLKDFATDYVEKLFLTNVPRGERIQMIRGQDVYLEQISDASSQLLINFYDATDVLIDSYTDTQTYPIWQLNLKDSLLNAVITAGIANVAYFTVRIGLSSEILTFEYFDDYCNYPFALQWMNEYGSFDQFVFKHNNQLKSNVDSNSYRSQFGSWVGNSFVYSVVNTGQIDYVKNIKESGILTTDYVTEEFQNYLVELFDSPFYLLYDINGYVIAITVTTNSYDYEQSRFDELFNIEVKYNKSSSKRSITI